MARRVKIGLLGGGMMSQVGHLPFYLQDQRCEVVRVAESRPSLIEALGQRLGPERIVADHRILFDDPMIEALVISTPRAATGPLTLAALECGKHVLVEKPMAHTTAQATRLVENAAAHGLIYAVGYMKRYDPGVQRAKTVFDEAMATGSLGCLIFARFYGYSRSYDVPVPSHVRPKESRTERFPEWPRWPDWLPEQYCEPYAWFLNAASHDVNLLRYFFPGDLALQTAHSLHDGAVVASLRNGSVPVVLEIAKADPGRWLEGAEFLFEYGRIGLDIPSPMAMNDVASVVLDDSVRGMKAARLEIGQGWCFQHQAAGFIDALTGASPPLTRGEDALSDLMLIEGMWRKIAAVDPCPNW
jgi:predicted dehydrogenase